MTLKGRVWGLTGLEDGLPLSETLALDDTREERQVVLLVVLALEERHRVDELV